MPTSPLVWLALISGVVQIAKEALRNDSPITRAIAKRLRNQRSR